MVGVAEPYLHVLNVRAVLTDEIDSSSRSTAWIVRRYSARLDFVQPRQLDLQPTGAPALSSPASSSAEKGSRRSSRGRDRDRGLVSCARRPWYQPDDRYASLRRRVADHARTSSASDERSPPRDSECPPAFEWSPSSSLPNSFSVHRDADRLAAVRKTSRAACGSRSMRAAV